MKSKLQTFFFGKADVSPEAQRMYADGQQKLREMTSRIESMRKAFTEGGSITFDQLNAYIVSTPETPMKYETGKHCFAFRIPCPDPNKIMFYCTFEPPEGEVAKYGWHEHPDCDEDTLQMEGIAEANGENVMPFQLKHFPAGVPHNYGMTAKGAILVTFTRVIKV